jgi:hypothetical protein
MKAVDKLARATLSLVHSRANIWLFPYPRDGKGKFGMGVERLVCLKALLLGAWSPYC